MEDKIRIFGESDCYGLRDDFSFTLRITAEMTEEIDENCMREAVRLLEKRFSYLKVSLCRNQREFYYRKNPRPWVVRNSPSPVTLNSEETNYQLQAFGYYETRIFADVFHGQLDGKGMYALFNALLYNYCSIRYRKALKADGILKPDDPVTPEEYEDAYLNFYRKMKSNPPKAFPVTKKARPDVMRLSRMGKVRMAERFVYRIEIPQSQLMAYCSNYDGSPVSAVGLMLAESIRKLHEDSPKDVVIGIPVNLRPVMGLKNSHCSTYSKIYVPFTEKIRGKSFEMQGTMFRGKVIVGSEETVLKPQVYQYCKLLNLLNYIPSTRIKQLLAGLTAAEMIKKETADVSYTGRVDYGELTPFIKSVFCDVDAYGLGIILLINAIADRFVITINQDFGNDKFYINSFLSELTRRSIDYTFIEEGSNPVAKMNIHCTD